MRLSLYYNTSDTRLSTRFLYHTIVLTSSEVKIIGRRTMLPSEPRAIRRYYACLCCQARRMRHAHVSHCRTPKKLPCSPMKQSSHELEDRFAAAKKSTGSFHEYTPARTRLRVESSRNIAPTTCRTLQTGMANHHACSPPATSMRVPLQLPAFQIYFPFR